MRSALFIAFIFSILVLTHVSNSYSMAQISMQNNTSFWLNFYIDGNFGCGPVMPNGFCTSSVKAGPHDLEAKAGQEVKAIEQGVSIGDGTSPTWTVTIEDPDAALIKKLNGARYINHREWPKIKAEYELVIKGTSLVWKMRFTEAASNITLPRPIETWHELGRGEIVGREARIRIQNPAPDDVVFTIGEDGDTITGKEKTGTFIFHR